MNKNSNIVVFSDLIKGKENNFDLLRFIAAVAVIFSHSFPLTGFEDPFFSLSGGQVSIGDLAVIIFFVISGYFITQSFQYSQSPLKYIKARVLRIFPALAFAVTFSVFVIGLLFTTLPWKSYLINIETFMYIKAILLYPMQWNLPGVFEGNLYPSAVNGSLWSIPFEFMFYILVLVLGIFSLLNKKVSLTLFSLLFILYVLDYWPFTSTHFWGLEIKKIIELLTYFTAGMVFYFFKERIAYSNFFAFLSIIILFMAIYIGGFKELFVILGTYLIFYLGYNQSLKTWKYYKYGDFSYGMYVFAFPIQQAIVQIFKNNINPYLNFTLAFSITLVMAVISWYLVEEKALKLKNKHILNDFVVEIFKKIGLLVNSFILSIKNFILRYVKIFVILFLVTFGYVFNSINSYTSEIVFPFSSSISFFGNWIGQSPTENYRWIMGSAGVKLKKELNTNNLEIIGYVPENFTEVKSVAIWVDGVEKDKYDIIDGQINFVIDLSDIQESKIIDVNIVFNEIHVPEQTAPDQRQMSGLISSIKVY